MPWLSRREVAAVVAAVILAALTSWAMWTLDIGRPDGGIPVPEPVPVVVGFDATG